MVIGIVSLSQNRHRSVLYLFTFPPDLVNLVLLLKFPLHQDFKLLPVPVPFQRRFVVNVFLYHDSSDDESLKENKHTNGEENKHTKEEEHKHKYHHNEPSKVEETTEKHSKTETEKDSGEIQKEPFLSDVTKKEEWVRDLVTQDIMHVMVEPQIVVPKLCQ